MSSVTVLSKYGDGGDETSVAQSSWTVFVTVKTIPWTTILLLNAFKYSENPITYTGRLYPSDFYTLAIFTP